MRNTIRLSSLSRLHAVMLCVVFGAADLAVADVLTLKDGRMFEGTVSEEKSDSLQFETIISGIRAKLTFEKSNVKSIEKKALPKPEGEVVEIGPGRTAATEAPTLYLEIPIKGRFKEQVFVSAIRSTLAYAKLHGVKHVVFTVDSTGGAVDEAGAMYRNLRDFENVITYHAVITNCTGEAVIIPFLCRTLHIEPGATIGGLTQELQNLPGRFRTKDDDFIRAQLADDLAELARQRGRKGEIIRALVDPPATLAAWVDEKGEVHLDKALPPGVPSERVIFQDGTDQVLTLSFEQATRLGVPSVQSGAQALGAVLGYANWREESGYGRDTMNKAVASKRRRDNAAQAKFEDDVTRSVQMREVTSRAIETNLKQAATWNPTTASYKKLIENWNPVWTSETPWDARLWTPESRQKWQSRTDACAHFLSKAKTGIETMMRLDKEAGTLGLSPTFKEGDLAAMLDDVNVKLQMLATGRSRVGE